MPTQETIVSQVSQSTAGIICPAAVVTGRAVLRCACWLPLLSEAHTKQNPAELSSDIFCVPAQGGSSLSMESMPSEGSAMSMRSEP